VSRILEIHQSHPQARLIGQVIECLRDGGVVAYPTDSCYALGCILTSKDGPDRVRQIRDLGRAHHFSVMCRGLADVSVYARMDNDAFRWLKSSVPGPYTFIMRATGEVPRRVQHARRRTIGVRVPANPIANAILESLAEGLMSSTLQLPDAEQPLVEPREILTQLRNRVDLIVDGGPGDFEPSTIVDLTTGAPEVVRRGCGDPALFE
jgi:tRNA threonylcarbamoyl adenosine modification protein (Sua5/YciO/YrdC/YwlC family)